MANASVLSRPTGKQIALMAAATMLVVLSVYHSFDPVPTITIPTPKMPIPNGYDLLVKAHNACVERDNITAAAFPSTRFRNMRKFTPAQQLHLRDENLQVFPLIRTAIDMPFRLPPMRSFDDMMPGADPYRLTGLLVLDAHIKERQGDWKGAAESVMQAIKLDEIEPHGGGMFSLLGADRALGLSLGALLTISPHVDAATNVQLANQLSALADLHVPFADTVEADKWMEVASMQKLLSGPHWREHLVQMTNMNGTPSISAFTPINRRKVVKDYMSFMDTQIALAKQPYGPNSLVWSAPSDPILRNLIVPSGQERSQDTSLMSQTSITVIRLAIEAYRQKHNRYPASLSELVPEELKQFPSDPFSNGGTPGYKLDKQGYTLYSTAGQLSPPVPGPGSY
jgi:hypothetical protein